MTITEKVKNYIEEEHMLDGYSSIVIGVSGGADSICLLTILNELYGTTKQLRVVHVNHCLRENAVTEENFVLDYCESLGIQCISRKVDVKALVKQKGLSTEEAGRILRYQIFNEMANDENSCIALAHNMDDNAETMLLNMFRGASIRGMCGIRAVRGNIVRPILCLSRKEIEEYLAGLNIEFCTDESNLTDEYARNRIRHNVLPYASQHINSRAVSNMNKLSKHVTMAQDYIDYETDKTMSECAKFGEGHIIINTEKLKKYHLYIQKNCLYRVLGEIAGALKDIEDVHILNILDLMEGQTGRGIDLPYGVRVSKIYDGLRFYKSDTNINSSNTENPLSAAPKMKVEKEKGDCAEDITSKNKRVEDGTGNVKPVLKNMSEITLNCNGVTTYKNVVFMSRVFDRTDDSVSHEEYTKWFDYDKIGKVITVRNRSEGDWISINNNSRKMLKKYFIDEKIPSYERDFVPLICDGHHIIWIVGKRISNAFKIDENTKRILEITAKIENQ